MAGQGRFQKELWKCLDCRAGVALASVIRSLQSLVTCRYRKVSVAIAEEEFKPSTTTATLPHLETLRDPRNVKVQWNCSAVLF